MPADQAEPRARRQPRARAVPSGQAQPQATAAVLAIFKTSSWLLSEVNPVFAEHGITATRFDALEALSRCDCGARPAELRDLLHLPAQTVTGVLDQLQSAGLIRRSPHPTDRRSTMVELTEQGRAAVGRMCPPLIDIEEDCMSGLSPDEQAQLIDLLARVRDRIAKRRDWPQMNREQLADQPR